MIFWTLFHLRSVAEIISKNYNYCWTRRSSSCDGLIMKGRSMKATPPCFIFIPSSWASLLKLAEATANHRNSLTSDTVKMLSQAYMGNQLDYCNNLLYGVDKELLGCLQIVHYASVAQPSLVASAAKNNFQDRHLNVPVLEQTGT